MIRLLLAILFLLSSIVVGYFHKPLFLIIGLILFVLIILLEIKSIVKQKKKENGVSIKHIGFSIIYILFICLLAVFIRDISFTIRNSDKCPHESVFTNKSELEKLNNSFDFEKYIIDLKESSQPFKTKIDSIKYKNKFYPFFTISTTPKNYKQKILIIASVHGDEPAGALAIPQLLKDITANEKKYENSEFLILCPMNPVGLAFTSRENECGCNINRDYSTIKQPQTQHIINSIKKFKPTTIIDLHENHGSWKTCIMANEIISDDYGQLLCDILSKDNIELADNAFDNSNLTIKGWHKFTTYRKLIRKIVGVDDLFWFCDNNNIPLITLECDQSLELNKRTSICLDVIESVSNKMK